MPDVRAWRSFTRLFEGRRRLIALSLGLAICQSLALLPIGLVVRRIFDTAIPSGDRTQLVLLGAAVVVLFTGAAGLGLFGRYLLLTTTKAVVARLRIELLTRIQTLPRAWLDGADVGVVHSTIVQDSERIDVMINSLFGLVIPAVIVATALLGSLAFIDVTLLLVLLAVIPALVLLARWMQHSHRRLVHDYQRNFDRYSSRVLSNLRATLTIKAQGAEDVEQQAGSAEIAKLAEDGRRLAWLWGAQIAVHGITASIAGMLVLVIGGFSVIDGDMSVGTLFSFLSVLALARGQVNTGLVWAPQIVLGREALVRLDEFLDVDAPQPYTGHRQQAFRGALTADDVSFGYGPVQVLTDVRISIEPGERIALTGPNGAGKSTFVALLLGLYRPDRGHLCADGVPYDELDMRGLRAGFGVLLQDPLLFRGSVRDNIAYGSPVATQAEIEEAAVIATAAEVIADMPNGYATEVGDDGELLSGGQRQRIALARALLGRPPFLILDEPSSHFDDETTARFLRNLTDLPWEPAILLITHDPVVAATADRVVEVRDGRLLYSQPMGG